MGCQYFLPVIIFLAPSITALQPVSTKWHCSVMGAHVCKQLFQEPWYIWKPLYPFIRDMLPARPMYFAHAAIQRDTKPRVRPTAIIFSCIFSHTRGTPKNAVGRTSFIVSTREPCVNKCCQKYIVSHKKRATSFSTITLVFLEWLLHFLYEWKQE